jgi:hypothetical protein
MDLKKLISEIAPDKPLMQRGANLSENFKKKAKNVGFGIANIIDLFFDAMSHTMVKGADKKNTLKTNLKPVAAGPKVSLLKPQQDVSQAFYTNISEGQRNPLRKGDSVANILAKMFNFMKMVHEEEIKQMEVARNLARRNKYMPPVNEKAEESTYKAEKSSETEEGMPGFLKKLLTGLAAAALAIAGVYAALKGLLDPFINIFNNIKIPNLATLPVFNPFSRTPMGGGNAGRGKVNPTEHDEEERRRLQREKDKTKTPGKTTVPNASGQNTPNEEPSKVPNEPGKPTSASSKVPATGKPGFLDTAEDKIRQRATRLAGAAGARGVGVALKEGVKFVGKNTLKRFLGGPFSLAITTYDIADALAPSEKEALNTHVETLISIEDDVDLLQKKYDNGEITGQGFDIAIKQKKIDAKTVEEKIRVLKKKAEDETYKEEAKLNQQAAEDGITTLADEVKGMGRDTATAVHSITKPIKDLGARAAINYKNNTADDPYVKWKKENPTKSYSDFLKNRYEEFSIKKEIREDPLTKEFLKSIQDNNDLQLKSSGSPISYIDNSKTNNVGSSTGSSGLTVASSAPVRNVGFDSKFLNDRFA